MTKLVLRAVHGLAALTLALAGLSAGAQDEADEEMVELEVYTAEDEAEDPIGILPSGPMEAVFGFDKTLLETPRSATSITIETIDQFGITEIDDFVVLSPGSFTQSFFGVSGSLDLRGTSGENYFNGIRRLDNPGNYTVPIGAADRVDIVRGPASVIYGPSKIGGYMNFVPKSARAETGQYLERPTGELSAVVGSWDKAVITGEVGGPGRIGDKSAGYYLFGQIEDSGSFYQNTELRTTNLQATFNIDLTDRSRLAFGGMLYRFDSNQVAGWNRISQALIDDRIYVTGLAKPLDTDGDGSISHGEYNAANGGGGMFSFVFNPAGRDGPVTFGDDFSLDPATVGTTRLQRDQVLVSPDDVLQSDSMVLYLDFIHTMNDRWSLTNKLYYEEYDNLSENAYGFSQEGKTWVLEDQLIFKFSQEFDAMRLSALLSPSIRHTDFDRGDDFINEHFDRRDLTRPSTARDLRLLATRINKEYTEYHIGDHTVIGVAALVDMDFNNGLNIILGVRQDRIDMESYVAGDLLLFPEDPWKATDTEGAFSWTASVSYTTSFGLVPYFTASEQTTMITSQQGDIAAENIRDGEAVAGSELIEGGVKGSFLDNRLFMQAAYYEQERIDFSAQSIVTNQASKTEGFEFELRWLASEKLTLTAAFTNIEVVNLSTLNGGGRFSFLGADDLPDTPPWTFYGGTVGGQVLLVNNPEARRAGIPENILSLSAIYDVGNGWKVFGSVTDVDSVYSGFSQAVELPAYTLVNAGLQYDAERWSLTLNGKNLTDEEYFRSNFPNLFGSVIVLPELPRHFQASVAFRF